MSVQITVENCGQPPQRFCFPLNGQTHQNAPPPQQAFQPPPQFPQLQCPPGCVPAPPQQQQQQYDCQQVDQGSLSPSYGNIVNQFQQQQQQQQYLSSQSSTSYQQQQSVFSSQSTASVEQLPGQIREVLSVADRVAQPRGGKITYINESCNQQPQCDQPQTPPPQEQCYDQPPQQPDPCYSPPPPPQQNCEPERSNSPYEVLPIIYVDPCDQCDPCNRRQQQAPPPPPPPVYQPPPQQYAPPPQPCAPPPPPPQPCAQQPQPQQQRRCCFDIEICVNKCPC